MAAEEVPGGGDIAASIGFIVPSAVVDVEVMYEGALPPPYFHRVTDARGTGVNLAASSGRTVSLWYAQHSDKETLGKPPVVALTVVHGADTPVPEGFTRLSKEVLRAPDDADKAYLAVKRRESGGTELGLGGIAATYGDDTPEGEGWEKVLPALHDAGDDRLRLWTKEAEEVADDDWDQSKLAVGDWVDVLDHSTWRLGRVVEVGEDGTLTVRMKGWAERYDKHEAPGSANLARPGTKSTKEGPLHVRQGDAFDIDWEAVDDMIMKVDDYMSGEFPEHLKDTWLGMELPYFVEKALVSKYDSDDMHPRVNGFNQKVLELIAWFMRQLEEDVPEAILQQLGRLYLADAQCNFFFNRPSHGVRGDSAEASKYNGACGKLPPGGASKFFVSNLNHFHECGGYDAMLQRLQREKPIPMAELSVYTKVLEVPKRCYDPGWVGTFLGPLVRAAAHRCAHGDDADYNDLAETGVPITIDIVQTLVTQTVNVASTMAQVEALDELPGQLLETHQANVYSRALRHPRLAVRIKAADGLVDLGTNALRASGKLASTYTGYYRPPKTKFFKSDTFVQWARDHAVVERMLDMAVAEEGSEAAVAAGVAGKTTLPALSPGHVAFAADTGIHLQMIKRAVQFGLVMAREKADLPPGLLPLLMHAAEREGSPAAESEVFSIISSAASMVPVDQLSSLFENISAIPIPKWTEATVTLMDTFTTAAAGALYEAQHPPAGAAVAQDAKEPATTTPGETPLFALPLLWSALTGDAPAPEAVKEDVKTVFVKLLKEPVFRPQVQHYVQECVANITSGKNPEASCRLASSLLEALPRIATYLVPAEFTQGAVITQLATTQELLPALLREMAAYKEAAQKAAAAAGAQPACGLHKQLQATMSSVWEGQAVPSAEGSALSAASDELVVGDVAHTEAVEARLEFLGKLVGASTLQLSVEQLQELFKLFVSGCVTRKEQETFLKWLRLVQFGEVGVPPHAEGAAAFAHDTTAAVFQQLFCSPEHLPVVGLQSEGLAAFQAFFLYLNGRAGKVTSFSDAKRFKVVDVELDGLSTLWRIVAQTRSAAVRNAAMSLLISLHVRLDPSSGLVVGRVVQDFAHSILDRLHLIHSSQDPSKPQAAAFSCATALLRMLRVLLVTAAKATRTDFADVGDEVPATGPITLVVNVGSLVETHEPSTQILTLPQDATFYQLRETIAAKVRYDPAKVRLSINEQEIDAAMQELGLVTSEMGWRDVDATLLPNPSGDTCDHPSTDHPEDFSVEQPVHEGGDAAEPSTAAATAQLAEHIAQDPKLFQQILETGSWAMAARAAHASPFLVRLGSSLEQETWLLLRQLPTNKQVAAAVDSLEEGGEGMSWRELCGDAGHLLRMLYTMDLMQAAGCEQVKAAEATGEEAKAEEGDGEADPEAEAEAEASKPKPSSDFVDASGVNVDEADEPEEEEEEEADVDPWTLLTPAAAAWSARLLNAGALTVLVRLLGSELDVEGVLVRGSTLAKMAVARLLAMTQHTARLAAVPHEGVTCDSVPPADVAAVAERIMRIMQLTAEAGSRRAEEAAAADDEEDEDKAGAAESKGADNGGGSGGYYDDDDDWGGDGMDYLFSNDQRGGYNDGLGLDDVASFMATGRMGPSTAPNLSRQASDSSVLSPDNIAKAMRGGLGVTEAAVEANIIEASVGVVAHLVRTGGDASRSVLQALYSFDGVGDVFLQGVLSATEEAVRKEVMSGILQLCSAGSVDSVGGSVKPPGDFFVPLLVDRLVLVYSHPDTCQQFFDLLAALIQEAAKGAVGKRVALPIDAPALAASLSQLIRLHPVVELTAEDKDPVLQGLLTLTAALAVAYPSMKETLALEQTADGKKGHGLLEEVFTECLFRVPSPEDSTSAAGGGIPPKCKHVSTRAAAFSLLLTLAEGSNTLTTILANKVLQQRTTGDSSGTAMSSYQSRYTSLPRSSAGYAGIVNPGCTCYMNSSLQQFFMTREFRKGVLAFKDTEEDRKESMMYQLQLLFAHLQETQRMAVDIKPWCHAFKDWDGQPTSLSEQKDASEFLTQLFQNMEVRMQGSPQENMLKEVFGGTSVQELVAKSPDGQLMYSRRSSPHMMLEVPVQGHKSLAEGLAASISGETVDYSWETGVVGEDGKEEKLRLETMKRTSIETAPEHLIVHLKRFEFDFQTLQQKKLDDYYQFPRELNLWDYTLYGRADRDQPVQDAGGAVAGTAAAEEADAAATVDFSAPEGVSADDFQYTLVGVVVHTGTAHGGHYYSYIRERSLSGPTSRWLLFNDSSVSEWDDSDLEAQTFGGEYEAPRSRYVGFGNTNYGGTAYGGAGYGSGTYKVSRCANGFLLFYDKVPKQAGSQPAQSAAEGAGTVARPAASQGGGASTDKDAIVAAASAFAEKMRSRYKGASVALETRVPVPGDMYREIWQDNLTFWRRTLMSDKSYMDFLATFVDKMASQAKLSQRSDAAPSVYPASGFVDDEDAEAQAGGNLPVLRLLTTFVLKTVAGGTHKSELPKWIARIQRLLGNDLTANAWMLQYLLRGAASAGAQDSAGESKEVDAEAGRVDIGGVASALKALLLDSRDEPMQDAVADLLVFILRKLAPHEELPAPADAPAARAAAWAKAQARAEELGRPLDKQAFPAPPGLLVSTTLDAFVWLMPDLYKSWYSFKPFTRMMVNLVEEKHDATRHAFATHLLQRKMLGMIVDLIEADSSAVKCLHDAAKCRAFLINGIDAVSEAFAQEQDSPAPAPVPAYSYGWTANSGVGGTPSRRMGNAYSGPYLHFVYRTFNGLIRHALPISGVGGSPSQQGVEVPLSPPEIALLGSKHLVQNTLAHQMSTRQCANWLQHTFVQLAWNNEEVSRLFSEKCVEMLSRRGYKEMDAVQRLAGVLLGIQDEHTPERLEYFMCRWWDTIKGSSKYYYETLHCLELSMRHAKHRPAVRKWMVANPTYWDWAVDWLATNVTQPVYTMASMGSRLSLCRVATHLTRPAQQMQRHPNLLANYRVLARAAEEAAPEGDGVLSAAAAPLVELYPSGWDSEDDEEELVGKRVKVQRPYNRWETGTVVGVDGTTHKVKWDAGFEEEMKLSRQFFLIEGEGLAPAELRGIPDTPEEVEEVEGGDGGDEDDDSDEDAVGAGQTGGNSWVDPLTRMPGTTGTHGHGQQWHV